MEAKNEEEDNQEALDEEETFDGPEVVEPFNVKCEEVCHDLKEETLEVKNEEEDDQEVIDEVTADRHGRRGSRTRQRYRRAMSSIQRLPSPSGWH